jgi:hypothetical protein
LQTEEEEEEEEEGKVDERKCGPICYTETC